MASASFRGAMAHYLSAVPELTHAQVGTAAAQCPSPYGATALGAVSRERRVRAGPVKWGAGAVNHTLTPRNRATTSRNYSPPSFLESLPR